MAISFPSNPTVGQQYTASNITWEWNGSSWASLPPSSGIGLTNLSVTQSAVGTAALSYNNSSGAFSYTPPDLSSYLTSYTETDTLSSVTGRGATTNTSLTFGGSLTVAGSANVSLDSGNLSLGSGGIQAPSSSQNLNWGSGNFYFNSGSPEIGWSNGSGTLRTVSSSGAIFIKGGSPAENLGVFKTGGAVELYYDNTKKLETTGVGVTVFGTTQTQQLNVTGVSTFNGAVDVTANVEFKAAAGNSSLYMYDGNAIHFGSNNDARLIYFNNGNKLKFERSGSAGEIEIDAAPVTLKHSDNIKLQTTTTGVNVTGSVTANSFIGDGSGITGVTASGSGIIIRDNGTLVGTIGTINFGTNLSVSAASAGIVTVTASGGSSGGLSSRSVVTATTGSVSVGATTNLSITGFKSYGLLKINTSAASWVKLYVDDASRTSDANRSYLEDPLPGSGLIAEARSVSSGSNNFIMTPGIVGWNNDSTTGSTIYLSVTNNETSSSAITVDLTVVKLED